MKKLGDVLLFGGLIAAVLIGLFLHDNALVPWITAGCGLGLGVLIIGPREPNISTLLGLIGLVLAIFVIETQWYNPAWLNHVLLYVRVFVSHALLGAGSLAFFRVARPKS